MTCRECVADHDDAGVHEVAEEMGIKGQAERADKERYDAPSYRDKVAFDRCIRAEDFVQVRRESDCHQQNAAPRPYGCGVLLYRRLSHSAQTLT